MATLFEIRCAVIVVTELPRYKNYVTRVCFTKNMLTLYVISLTLYVISLSGKSVFNINNFTRHEASNNIGNCV
jgi:hypothetical protein